MDTTSLEIFMGTTNFTTKNIRIPNNILGAEITQGFDLFKGNLKVELGGKVNWYSSYFANAYEPSTGVGYNQNHTEIGNYPMVDLYVNNRIKKASIFIMVTHLNQNWTGRKYFSAPGYPLYGRRIWFGVNWQFVN